MITSVYFISGNHNRLIASFGCCIPYTRNSVRTANQKQKVTAAVAPTLRACQQWVGLYEKGGYSHTRRTEWAKKTRGQRTENKISRKSVFKM